MEKSQPLYDPGPYLVLTLIICYIVQLLSISAVFISTSLFLFVALAWVISDLDGYDVLLMSTCVAIFFAQDHITFCSFLLITSVHYIASGE